MSTWYTVQNGRVSRQDLENLVSECGDLELYFQDDGSWTITQHCTTKENDSITHWLHFYFTDEGDVIELARYGQSNPEGIIDKIVTRFSCKILSQHGSLYPNDAYLKHSTFTTNLSLAKSDQPPENFS